MSNLERIEISNSITSGATDAEDKNNPFSFARWLELSNTPNSKADDYVSEYNSYIQEWTNEKSLKAAKSQDTVEVYKSLLEQITVNYLTDEEKRFLQTIDYDDPGDIETSISFYSKRLKQITLYLSDKRDVIKQQPARYSLGGTNKGISLLIRKIITELLTDDNFLNQNRLKSVTNDEINSVRIDIQELYDINENYHNVSPDEDKSNYTDPSTLRSKLFTGETITYDPYLWIDFEQAIKNLLAENVSGVLGESSITSLLTNQLETIEVNIDSDINNLHESHFFNYIKSKENLNLYVIKKLVEETASTNMHYISTDENGPYISKLFDATNTEENIYNVSNLSRSTVPDTKYRTIKQLGGSFTPHNLGTYTFYSRVLGYEVVKSKIDPNRAYIIPDPMITGDDQGLIEYQEDISHTKVQGIGNTSVHGKHDVGIPSFYNYQSRQDINSFTVPGISKSTDSFDFWNSEQGKIWKNGDIFDYAETERKKSINARYNKLLHKHLTIYKQHTDVYGNTYALFKKIKPQPSTVEDKISDVCTDTRSSRLSYNDIVDSKYAEEIATQPRVKKATTFNIKNYTVSVYNAGDYSTVYTNKLLGGAMNSTPIFTSRGGSSFYPQLEPYNSADKNSCIIIEGEQAPDDFISPDIVLSGSAATSFLTQPTTSWDGKSFMDSSYDWCLSTDVELYEVNIVRNVKDIPYSSYITTPDSSTYSLRKYNDLSKPVSLYNQQDLDGELWFRNINSTVINRFDVVFKDIIAKYSGSSIPGIKAVGNDLKTKIRDFEIVQDILYIQTENYIVFERINYSYTSNSILPSTNENIYFSIPSDSGDGNGGHVIKPFYNENQGIIIFGFTMSILCGGIRTFGPTLYSIDIDTMRVVTLSDASEPDVIHNFRIPQSIVDVNIKGVINISKPILTYNTELEKYILITSGEIAKEDSSNDLYPIGQKCIIKADYVHIPTSSTFDIIDSTIYCMQNGDLRKEMVNTSTPRSFHLDLDTYVNTEIIEVGHPEFSVVFDCTLVRQRNDSGLANEFRSTKITKIEYDFGDDTDTVLINRRLDVDHNDDNNISLISRDGDINDPRLQKISHTYRVSGDKDSKITAIVRIHYISGFVDEKKIIINVKSFNSFNFYDVNLLEVNSFVDQYNKEKNLLTFEIGDDSLHKSRRLSTIILDT